MPYPENDQFLVHVTFKIAENAWSKICSFHMGHIVSAISGRCSESHDVDHCS